MAGLSTRSFESPDEVRTPDKTRIEVVSLGDGTVARLRFEPGWRWSECIKPVAGTASCQARHLGIVVSGGMHVVHDDGSESDVAAGEAYLIEPGHDAWVTGSEPMVSFEFNSATAQTYAKPS